MPNKELLRQLEMEKQRRGISSVNPRTAADAEIQNPASREYRYTWEYELEAYRVQKRRGKWLVAGALCGGLSLILEIGFHWGTIMNLTGLWPLK